MIILPSLEIVPAKYNGSTLLSQIPIDGTGNFAVTRATSPTTNRSTRVNALGQIELVDDNVPRLDYPIGGGCPALLVEPSATNYLVRSQEFDNASWGKNATGIDTSIGTSGIQANVAVSPDGTQNADRVNFVLQTDPDLGLNQNYAAATSTQTYNTSIWFKGEGTNIGKQIKVQIKRTSGGIFVGTTATITLTSGWVRFASSAITLGASNSGVQVIVSSNDATNALIWGSQLEQGSVPTSYIPTTTASVTRSAEVVSKTGISSLIGQTEGTIYAELDFSRAVGTIAIILGNGSSENFRIRKNANFSVLVQAVNTPSGTVSLFTSPAASAGIYKIAFGYKNGDYAMSVNGAAVLTSNNSANFPVNALDRIFLGDTIGGVPAFNDRILAVAFYPNRLPNTQLALLTSPYTSYSSMASALSYTLG